VQVPEVKKDRNVSLSPSVSSSIVLHISYLNTTRNHTVEQDSQSGKLRDLLFESYPFRISTGNTEYCD